MELETLEMQNAQLERAVKNSGIRIKELEDIAYKNAEEASQYKWICIISLILNGFLIREILF